MKTAGSKRGVTIIETMVAIVVIAIAAVASLEFYALCQRNFITNAALKSIAANFARETMEGYYLRDYNDPDLNVGTTPVPLPASPPSPLGSHGGTRNYTVTQKTGYKLIETYVDWTK